MNIIKRNNITISGEGTQPMIFAHGFGCDKNMWRFIIPEFENDYRIIAFDYVGHGKSDISEYNSERYANLYGYVQDVLDICEALQLKKAIFVGHSVSSMIGLLAAVKAPHFFDKMIFIGPSARYINDMPGYKGGFERKDIEQLLETMERNYIGWAQFLAPAIMKNPERPELSQELQESFCSTDPLVARQFAEVTFFSDNREDLPKMRTPSLLMQCSDDLIAPMEVGVYIADHTPNSILKVMKATGHCPHMSEPEETIQLMKDYLSSFKN